jgi:hypothetical protein
VSQEKASGDSRNQRTATQAPTRAAAARPAIHRILERFFIAPPPATDIDIEELYSSCRRVVPRRGCFVRLVAGAQKAS